jgi:hypothetical protein
LVSGGKLYIDGASADKFGFDCVRKPAPEIIQRDYSLIGPTIYGRWRLTSYIYAWHGATLDLVRRDTTVHHGLPGQRAMRPGPGCDPLTGYRWHRFSIKATLSSRLISVLLRGCTRRSAV